MMQRLAAWCCICYTLAMRLTVTLSPEVIKLLRSAAKSESRSVSAYVARLLDKWVAAQTKPAETTALGGVLQAMGKRRAALEAPEVKPSLDDILVPVSKDK